MSYTDSIAKTHSRFDSVEFDETSLEKREALRAMFCAIENTTDEILDGRSKSVALTKLEEAWNWLGKAIRDEQLQLRS